MRIRSARFKFQWPVIERMRLTKHKKNETRLAAFLGDPCHNGGMPRAPFWLCASGVLATTPTHTDVSFSAVLQEVQQQNLKAIELAKTAPV